MTATTTTDSRSLAFLDGTARILASRRDDDGSVSVIEMSMPEGSMPPPHIHDEDESVYVLAGKMTFYVGDEPIRVGARQRVDLPRGVAHTYRVESPGGAQWISLTASGRYEDFVREVGRPADARSGGPAQQSLADLVALTRAAARNGIEIVGAPGSVPGGAGSDERAEKRPRRFRLPLRPLAAPLARAAA
ncbi:MAG: cupin domain-containing protein [Thermoleophilia bacterium]|nr:cupin domain-containing protein [Thermoleophilia bacterium]MDQ3857245.1 cupin domain-containing protein [Actinomycetota bacterium]